MDIDTDHKKLHAYYRELSTPPKKIILPEEADNHQTKWTKSTL